MCSVFLLNNLLGVSMQVVCRHLYIETSENESLTCPPRVCS